jgi:hypothetical protein
MERLDYITRGLKARYLTRQSVQAIAADSFLRSDELRKRSALQLRELVVVCHRGTHYLSSPALLLYFAGADTVQI